MPLAKALLFGSVLCALPASLPVHSVAAKGALPVVAVQAGTAQDTKAAAPGVPFSAEKLGELLPATVYFQGRSAPLQLRNAAGTSFGKEAMLWASLVDTSGYSSSVQERYQFYFVTESGLRFGDVHLPAGAYGGGYLGDHFVIMDLGGHEIGTGDTHMDSAFPRPRPLQMVGSGPMAVKLYLGRRWVLLQADPAHKS